MRTIARIAMWIVLAPVFVAVCLCWLTVAILSPMLVAEGEPDANVDIYG